MEVTDKIFVGTIKTFIAFAVLYGVHTELAKEVQRSLKNTNGWRKALGITMWIGVLIFMTLGAVAFAGDSCLLWSRDGECVWHEDRVTFEVRWFLMFAIALITGVIKLNTDKETE